MLSESHASGAVNATGHGSLDEGSNVLILDSSLVLHHSALGVTIHDRDVLEIALTTLVTDGTVQGMVSQ